MFKKNIFAAALVLGSALLSAQAFAGESYFGGSVGRAKWNINCVGVASCHTAAATAKLFGGYEFTPNLGLEGSYVYLNEVSLDGINVNGRGFDFAGIAKTPAMNNFVGFAKLGVAFMKGEASVGSGSSTSGVTHYSSQPLLALGVMYQIDRNMSIRAEFDRRNVKVTGYRNTTFGVSNFSVGVQANF